MLVLIDESGCAGFKLGKGSSAFFVVGMVIFDDNREAEKTSASIQEAKAQLRVKPEFKTNKGTHPFKPRNKLRRKSRLPT